MRVYVRSDCVRLRVFSANKRKHSIKGLFVFILLSSPDVQAAAIIAFIKFPFCSCMPELAPQVLLTVTHIVLYLSRNTQYKLLTYNIR